MGEEFDDENCLNTLSNPLSECESLLDSFVELDIEGFMVSNETVSAPPSFVLLGLGLVLLFAQRRR